MNRTLTSHARSAGVTLLELLTVLVVIAILVSMLMPAFSNMASRMERSKCTMNLKAVYLGAEFYLQDHKQWPQINPRLAGDDKEEYARQWMAALQPYKVSTESWHCPSVQKLMVGDSRYAAEKSKDRIDYFPCPFDEKEITPHRWAAQPWFIERGAMHGEGNLIIFPDGSVKTLDEYMSKVKQ